MDYFDGIQRRFAIPQLLEAFDAFFVSFSRQNVFFFHVGGYHLQLEFELKNF